MVQVVGQVGGRVGAGCWVKVGRGMVVGGRIEAGWLEARPGMMVGGGTCLGGRIGAGRSEKGKWEARPAEACKVEGGRVGGGKERICKAVAGKAGEMRVSRREAESGRAEGDVVEEVGKEDQSGFASDHLTLSLMTF